MEIVVLNSDIARLVLDYLKSQKLKKATRTFCKTSPYLKQEFSAYKQGLQTHSFFPELEEIICEYVKISRKVEHLLPKLTDALRSKLQQCKLSEKVNELLERATHAILVSNVSGSKADLKSSAATTVAASQIGNVANENDGNKAKRKRSFENSNNSNDEQGTESNINKPNKLTPSRLGHCSKKRRILQPYCFLNAKALQRYKRGYHSKVSTTTTTDEDVEEENDEESPSSFEDATNSASELEELNDNEDCDEEEIFNSEKPAKESTPRSKSNRKVGLKAAPIIPGISQAILDNVEFQERLAENINQALNKSLGSKSTTTVPQKNNEAENVNTPSKKLPAAAEEITSSQLLDQMIKNILDATEKEPSFDAIIQEVVESSNKQPQVQTAAVQCNIKDPNLPSVVVGTPPLYIATEPPPLMPAQPITQLQQYPATISPITETITTNRNIFTIPATNVQPRTPIILRSAPGATAAASSVISSTSLTGQEPPTTMLGNNTIGSLIDPNFSISKLIVLNSNDSIQKQPPETTADNLVGQMSTSGIVDANDEQVYFDTTTGQLTFPVFITNDGLLTNFPFFINNEFVSHQLQSNNISNVEGSRSEIPFGEPIVVSANQLPPNTIILSNTQMESVSEKQGTTEKNNTKEQYNKIPPASMDNRLLHDKATPSSSGIINAKAFKSLSTPRKRTSHVRTLTFSPRGLQSVNNISTPLSTRTEAICRYQRSFPKTIIEESREINESASKSEEKENKTSEKPVIKTVEILPAITSALIEKVKENTNASTTETSSIPPLFVSEESSNQTIINKHAPVSKETSKESSKPKDLKTVAAQDPDKTPKRKQFRKTAVRSCKRQLTKAANEIENDLLEEKPEKENEMTTNDSGDQTDAKTTKDPLMEEWLRLRNSHVELDVRLREINAKSTQSTQAKKVNTKKRVRRKKPAAVKKKEKELVKKVEELKRSREQANETQCENLNTENQDIEELNKHSSNENPGKEKEPNSCVELKEDTTQNVNDKTAIPNTAKQNKMIEKKDNSSEKIEKQSENNTTNTESPPTASCQDSAPSQTLTSHGNDALEREKRTTNIAFLLETPFKDPNLASCNPPTPGIFAPSMETPAGKLKDRQDEMQASASFLFGSITKSELDTPLTTALTPGFRFTPFGLKEIGTPKSLPGTDYSSGGGSYYKPDESEDLDRNIDKMLRNSAQKKIATKEANDTDDVEQPEEGEIVTEEYRKEHVEETEIEKVEIEIPMEKLKVEPIVLKRVKSFGSEDVECSETAKIDPHYTLASGLPEISAAEEECSSSSSSSSGSSSSSKSSSSSSSASSSSSSSSSSSDASPISRTVLEIAQSNKQANINDLDSLSEISSTEDEEWQKLAVTDNDENSQLVGDDGEVRYPVRSWLTPIKEKITIETKTFEHTEVTQSTTSTKSTTIKVSLPLKSAEKRNIEVKELELKKERIKEKLKIDASAIAKKDKPAIAATPNISAALAATRVLHAMRDKGKKSASYQMPQSNDSNTVVETSPTVQEKRSLDVLTALNLSAKKHLPKTPENPQQQPPRLSEVNETLANPPNNLKGKNKIKISPPSINKTPQRKCLPIEARPVTRTIRKSGKKIVRTPLAFKVIHSPGKINSHSTTTTLAELAATKTLNKNKEAEGGTFIPQTVRVSPRLMKTSKLLGKKSPESPPQKSKVITRNTKAKASAVAKSKVTRSRNPTKDSTKAPLEKEMKKLLKDWKEESPVKKNVEQFEEETAQENVEQFEDETAQQNSVAAIKPKIHLKARNAMISMKQKNIAKRELLAAHKLEEEKTADTKTLSKELQTEHQVVLTPKTTCASPQTVKADQLPLTTVTSDCNNDDDDDDPLVDCKMTTIDETDTKRFIKYTFNGPDGPPAVAAKFDELSDFQMLVAIDENEKHIWRITEGICLFSCAPSLPKPAAATAPKKRKMRVSTVTTITSENTPSTGTAAPTAPTNTKIDTLKAFNTNVPTATSTPIAIQTSTSKAIAENKKQAGEAGGGSKSKVVTRQTTEASKKSLPETSNETPKIQIEDIESILSHLHGT